MVEIEPYDPQKVHKSLSVDKPEFSFELPPGYGREPVTKDDVFLQWFADEGRFNMNYGLRVAKSAAEGLFFGWFVTTARLAWAPHGIVVDQKGVQRFHAERYAGWGWTMNHYMRPLALCGGISAAFAAVECAMESIQGQEKPWWNQGAAGAVAGAMIGGLYRRVDYACSVSFVLGVVMTGLGYAQYRTINEKKWEAEGKVPVCNVTEETFKTQYPQYKDI
ncbi:hypothetical protein ACA910_018510 [Epithemia clementina (nom. ined.)]